MDPEVALQELRSLIYGPLKLEVPTRETNDEVVAAFEALDDWLVKGGAMPMAWQRD